MLSERTIGPVEGTAPVPLTPSSSRTRNAEEFAFYEDAGLDYSPYFGDLCSGTLRVQSYSIPNVVSGGYIAITGEITIDEDYSNHLGIALEGGNPDLQILALGSLSLDNIGPSQTTFGEEPEPPYTYQPIPTIIIYQFLTDTVIDADYLAIGGALHKVGDLEVGQVFSTTAIFATETDEVPSGSRLFPIAAYSSSPDPSFDIYLDIVEVFPGTYIDPIELINSDTLSISELGESLTRDEFIGMFL